MLAAAPGVVYVHEPFSVTPQDPAACPRFTTWYTYITPENEAPYRERLEQIMELRYPWWAKVRERPTLRGVAGAARRALDYRSSRLRGERPLIKAPGALMSAEWLVANFGTQIVALIRHPCAFVASIKRMNWRFSFAELTSQPLLMRDVLGPFEAEMRRLDATDHDLIDNGAEIWKIIHHVIRDYQTRHPEWIYVRQEDLATDPMGQYETLYGRLGLTMGQKARQVIEEHCYAKTPQPDEGQLHRLTRNSNEDAWSWRGKLTAAEVDRIRARVDDVSRHFYADETWNLPTTTTMAR